MAAPGVDHRQLLVGFRGPRVDLRGPLEVFERGLEATSLKIETGSSAPERRLSRPLLDASVRELEGFIPFADQGELLDKLARFQAMFRLLDLSLGYPGEIQLVLDLRARDRCDGHERIFIRVRNLFFTV